MIPVTRDMHGSGIRRSRGEHVFYSGAAQVRPGPGGAPHVTMPLPMAISGTDIPFAGMDPSNPLTYVRPWNPAPGMIAYLNVDGAQAQAMTETGGLQGAPASMTTLAGGRPSRRILR